jgi:cell division protease FtsH
MGALGYVMQVPEEEKFLNTQAELHDMLVGLLGGRAAEEIVFDTVTTGAANDIEKATSIARSMVTQYGMSKRFGLMGLETVESRYLDGRLALNCSDVTAADIDEEVMKILKDCYKEAKKLLKENRSLMDKLAGYLIKKETITGKEFMKIYRKAKGLPEPKEDEENPKTPSRINEKAKKSSKSDSDAASDEEDLDEYLKELEAEMEAEKKAEEEKAAQKAAAAAQARSAAEAGAESPADDQDLQTQIKKSFQAVVDDRISVTKTETIEYEARENTQTGAYSAPETEDPEDAEDKEEKPKEAPKAEDNDSDEDPGSGSSSLPSGGVFSGQS